VLESAANPPDDDELEPEPPPDELPELVEPMAPELELDPAAEPLSGVSPGGSGCGFKLQPYMTAATSVGATRRQKAGDTRRLIDFR
jgi:hypothetical protein